MVKRVLAASALAGSLLLAPGLVLSLTVGLAAGASADPITGLEPSDTPTPTPTPTQTQTFGPCVPPLCQPSPTPIPTPSATALPSRSPSPSIKPSPTPSRSTVTAPATDSYVPPAAGAGSATVDPVQSFGIGDAAPGGGVSSPHQPKQAEASDGSDSDPLTTLLLSAIGIGALLGIGGAIGLYLTRGPHTHAG